MSDIPLWLGDYDHFAAKLLKIRHKQKGDMVPLIATPAQRRIRDCKAKRKIILKGRQCGSSTDTLGKGFHHVMINQNHNAMTIAHETGVSEELLMKVRLFYEGMPPSFRPMMEYKSKTEGFYWPTLNTSFKIGTAGGRAAGAGRTLDFLHLSEMPKWEGEVKEIFLTALAAVTQDGEVVVESTAQGSGNYFHELWKQAVWNKSKGVKGPTVFEPIFISWMDDPSCAMSLVKGENLDEFYPLDAELREYEARLNLTPEQKKWHRLTRQQYGELFPQEFPSNPDEAFLANERCYFNTVSIARYRNNIEKPQIQGRLTLEGGKAKVVPDPEGAVSVWRPPQDDRPYVIFGDVAEGLEHGDYSDAYVYSPWDKDFVAAWHGHIDPDLYADELAMLGMYYVGLDGRVALIGVESNNHGVLTLVSLRRRLSYPRVYMQKFFNKRDKVETEKLGWRTDISSKRFMLDLLNAGVRDGELGIFDGRLLDQMATFLRDDRGLGGAEPPNHDDSVMAAAGCLVISQDIPRKPKEIEEIKPFGPEDGIKGVHKAWEEWDKRSREKKNVLGADALDY